jgi:DNA-binding Lrp family transcriptional regulator
MMKNNIKDMINILRKDSRIQLKDMSEKLNMPLSTTHSRLKKAESFIKRYTSILDLKKINYPIKIILIGKILEKKSHRKEKNQATKKEDRILIIKDNRYINNIYRISGSGRYLIEGIFHDMEELENFKDKIKQIMDIEKNNYIIIKEIENENFLLP